MRARIRFEPAPSGWVVETKELNVGKMLMLLMRFQGHIKILI